MGYNNVVSAFNNGVAGKYSFIDKEEQNELGLNWHDFGARNYQADLGRWMSVDNFAELAQELTPYWKIRIK